MLETYHTQQSWKHLTFGRQYGLRKSSFVDENPSFKDRNIKKTAQISFKAIEWEFCTLENWKQHIQANTNSLP